MKKCDKHQIELHSQIPVTLAGFGDEQQACKACEIESYFPWHEKEAERLKDSNPSLSAKHLIGIEESKTKIAEMMNGSRNKWAQIKK